MKETNKGFKLKALERYQDLSEEEKPKNENMLGNGCNKS